MRSIVWMSGGKGLGIGGDIYRFFSTWSGADMLGVGNRPRLSPCLAQFMCSFIHSFFIQFLSVTAYLYSVCTAPIISTSTRKENILLIGHEGPEGLL